jgi:hypothetical protein
MVSFAQPSSGRLSITAYAQDFRKTDFITWDTKRCNILKWCKPTKVHSSWDKCNLYSWGKKGKGTQRNKWESQQTLSDKASS